MNPLKACNPLSICSYYTNFSYMAMYHHHYNYVREWFLDQRSLMDKDEAKQKLPTAIGKECCESQNLWT